MLSQVRLQDLIKAHETYGSIPLAQLIQPTIDLLEAGVPITQDLYWAMQDTQFLKLDDESKNIYLNDKAVIGGKIFNDDLIRTAGTNSREWQRWFL